jgi:serine/threonine protein kinase/tetratricopeptide (TPR) repeat protein
LIQSRLGLGGDTTVWLAWDVRLSQKVAIKEINSAYLDKPSLLNRLKAEVDAGRKITSPHVVKIFDLLLTSDAGWLVMEYVEGLSFAELFGEQPAAASALENLAIQLASGLAAIHASGFCHADLKPANVLLDTQGRVVIVDLGLATEDFLGPEATCRFVAPEVERPRYQRADVYALGGMLRFLLGIPIESGSCEMDERSRWLAPVIQKCREHDAGRRYANGEELLSEMLRLAPSRRGRSSGLLRKWLSLLVINSRTARILLPLFPFAALLALHFSFRFGDSKPPERLPLVLVAQPGNDAATLFRDIVSSYLDVARVRSVKINEGQNAKYEGMDTLTIAVLPGQYSTNLSLRLTSGTGTTTASRVTLSRSRPVMDGLRHVAALLRLTAPSRAFDVPVALGEDLDRFSSRWARKASATDDPLPESWTTTPNIPALLLRAHIAVARYSRTHNPSARTAALVDLDLLQDLRFSTTETTLLRSELAVLDGDTARSVQILRSGTKVLFNASPLHARLCEQALKAGFADEALTECLVATSSDPVSASNYVSLARVYSALWRDESAVTALLTAIQHGQQDPNIYTSLGTLYLRLGQTDKARQAVARALEAREDPAVASLLGLCNMVDGRTKEGILLLRGAAANRPSLSTLATLGAALRWTGQYDEARVYLARAAKYYSKDTQDPAELGRLAIVEAQLLHGARADQLMSQALSRHNLNTELLYDSLIVDAFAARTESCRAKIQELRHRRFSMVFIEHDPKLNVLIRGFKGKVE